MFSCFVGFVDYHLKLLHLIDSSNQRKVGFIDKNLKKYFCWIFCVLLLKYVGICDRIKSHKRITQFIGSRKRSVVGRTAEVHSCMTVLLGVRKLRWESAATAITVSSFVVCKRSSRNAYRSVLDKGLLGNSGEIGYCGIASSMPLPFCASWESAFILSFL